MRSFDNGLGGSIPSESIKIRWRTKVRSTMYVARNLAVDGLRDRETLSAVLNRNIVYAQQLIFSIEVP